MTKFSELSIMDLQNIVIQINVIFDINGIDGDSKRTFWQCIDIGNKKFDMV